MSTRFILLKIDENGVFSLKKPFWCDWMSSKVPERWDFSTWCFHFALFRIPLQQNWLSESTDICFIFAYGKTPSSSGRRVRCIELQSIRFSRNYLSQYMVIFIIPLVGDLKHIDFFLGYQVEPNKIGVGPAWNQRKSDVWNQRKSQIRWIQQWFLENPINLQNFIDVVPKSVLWNQAVSVWNQKYSGCGTRKKLC